MGLEPFQKPIYSVCALRLYFSSSDVCAFHCGKGPLPHGGPTRAGQLIFLTSVKHCWGGVRGPPHPGSF